LWNHYFSEIYHAKAILNVSKLPWQSRALSFNKIIEADMKKRRLKREHNDGKYTL